MLSDASVHYVSKAHATKPLLHTLEEFHILLNSCLWTLVLFTSWKICVKCLNKSYLFTLMSFQNFILLIFFFLWNTKGEVLESCSFEFRLNSSVFVWQKYCRKRPAWLLQSWLGVTRRTRSSYVRQERSVPWCKPCERGRFLLRSRPPQRSNL